MFRGWYDGALFRDQWRSDWNSVTKRLVIFDANSRPSRQILEIDDGSPRPPLHRVPRLSQMYEKRDSDPWVYWWPDKMAVEKQYMMDADPRHTMKHYMARGDVLGHLLPGVHTSFAMSLHCWDNVAYSMTEAEYLQSSPGALMWVPARNGAVPASALPMGIVSTGEHIYMARITRDFTPRTGVLLPNEMGCRIVTNPPDKKVYREYEVLCLAARKKTEEHKLRQFCPIQEIPASSCQKIRLPIWQELDRQSHPDSNAEDANRDGNSSESEAPDSPSRYYLHMTSDVALISTESEELNISVGPSAGPGTLSYYPPRLEQPGTSRDSEPEKKEEERKKKESEEEDEEEGRSRRMKVFSRCLQCVIFEMRDPVDPPNPRDEASALVTQQPLQGGQSALERHSAALPGPSTTPPHLFTHEGPDEDSSDESAAACEPWSEPGPRRYVLNLSTLANINLETMAMQNVRFTYGGFIERNNGVENMLKMPQWRDVDAATLRTLIQAGETVLGGRGADKHELWVSRFSYHGHLLPDGHDRADLTTSDLLFLEVLVVPRGCPLIPEWVPASDGDVPANAFPGGLSFDGEETYVARAWHSGFLLPGRLLPSEGGCIIRDCVKMQMVLCTTYEVLTFL